MANVIPPGKLPGALLRRLLAGPELPDTVLLGPGIGEDAAAISIERGTLVVAADPITFAGAFGDGSGARSAVLVNANDIAVTGARPAWFLVTVLLPPGTNEEGVTALFTELREALAEVGATLVGGHTEVTTAVTRPVISGQMLGHTAAPIVKTGGLEAGDVLLQIGPVPIEGAAVLARAAEERDRTLDLATLARAAAAVDDPGIAVVDAALLAARLGATAMHDVTEGGLASALWELATASGCGLRVARDAILWFAPGLAVCRALDADPLATLGSGALLAGFKADRAAAAEGGLHAAGHAAVRIAVAEVGAAVVDAAGAVIPWPERDEVARVLADA